MSHKCLRAVVINSGCANACTGKAGFQDALLMQKMTADVLRISKKHVAICSTGVIGERLPMNKIQKGLLQMRVKSSKGTRAAEAIMTTDRVVKERAVRYQWKGRTITIGGIAKGAGMIHPNMATMIAVLSTDITMTHSLIRSALTEALENSFNAITVDGDESTNDTVLLLANGLASNPCVRSKNAAYQKFVKALKILTQALA